MTIQLATITLLVPSYAEGLAFFVDILGFELVEDVALSETKRWLVVAAPGGGRLLLAQADTDRQRASIGNQAGDRVFLFLATDDFQRDHDLYRHRGVRFLERPRHESYGTVAVFEDGFGNKWDLIQYH